MPSIVEIGEILSKVEKWGYAQAQSQYRDLVRIDLCITRRKTVAKINLTKNSS
jgi:hypothetical protein